MKKCHLFILSTMLLPCFLLSCGGDDDDELNQNNVSVVISDDGKASNGGTFAAINEKSFYLDYVKYSVSEGHLIVSGYDKVGFNGIAKIVSKINYRGNSYEVLGIGEEAFYGCSSLVSINIPNSIKYISYKAFYKCGFTSVTIPNNVTIISALCFEQCRNLVSIELPNNLSKIGDGAFQNCTSLTSIEIPNSVTSIGDYAFKGCISLTSAVKLENSKNLSYIGDEAFRGCTSLSSIIIPENLVYLGDYAYSGCSNLKEIYCYLKEPIGGNSFFDNKTISTATLYVPNESLNIYKSTAGWKDFHIMPLENKGNYGGQR